MTRLMLVLSLLMCANRTASGLPIVVKRNLPKVNIAKFIAMGCSVRDCKPRHSDWR